MQFYNFAKILKTMKPVLFILIFFLLSFQQITAQFKTEAGEMLHIICSEEYSGRGYALGGANKAAEFIKNKIEKYHLKKYDKSYFQNFKVKVNSFPGNNMLAFGTKNLQPGKDYIFSSTSSSLSGTFSLAVIDAALIKDKAGFKTFIQSDFSDKVILIDTAGLHSDDFKDAYNLITKRNVLKAKALIVLTEKNLIYVPSMIQNDFVLIYLRKSAFVSGAKEVTIDVESKYADFQTKNIIGYLKGKSDTSIVITAHYDHLGTMGRNVYFPGANDNGSGVVALLSLAKYFSQQKKLPYTLVFIFFSGEEIGLQGSYHYTQYPAFPLDKIKFLLNLDMVGSGDKGIQIVNGSVHKQQFDTIRAINEREKYLPEVKIRGAAANSDHYFFSENGVPAFFIYTLGAYKEYHNIYDNAEHIPLSKFDELMHLIIDFINNIQNSKTP